MVVALVVMIVVMVIIVASGFHGRPFPVTTNHPHPLTLQSTIPPFFQHFFSFLFLPALVLRHSSTRQRLLKSSRECKMWDRILGIPLDTSGYPQLCNGLKVAQQSSLGYPQRCRAHIGGDLLTDQGGCMLWIPRR